MKRISLNIMLNRLEKLPESATTGEIERTLKLSARTIDYWLADPQFKKADIAGWSTHKRTYIWDKERLIAWIFAVMKLSETKGYRAKKKNPNVAMNPSDAAKMLGIPEGYQVKR